MSGWNSARGAAGKLYRLLGIRPFETNPDVIDSAADRQMAHLRTFQGGTHSNLSQRLLNEVAAARICLLKSTKKAAYDQQLRAAMQGLNTPTQSSSAIGRGAVPTPGGSGGWIERCCQLAGSPSPPGHSVSCPNSLGERLGRVDRRRRDQAARARWQLRARDRGTAAQE